MKRLLLLLTLLCGLAFGQNSFQVTTFSTTGTGVPIKQSSTIQYHQVSWVKTGTVSSCTVAVDSSPDNITYTAGGIITGQTCTSNGSSAVTAASAAYVRVNVTALGGGGTITITYKGWVNNPSGAGASFNQTIADEGISLTQRGVLNFTGAGITCVDNSGSTRTDCTVTSGGTVTSVALTAPAELSVGGSPITGAGTLALTWATQTTNKVFASPNGSTGVPTFRALVGADIPAINLAASGNGGVTGNLPYSQLSGAPTIVYQLIGDDGTSQTARNRLNLVSGTNSTVTCADNSGTNSTDCTIASTASGTGTVTSVGLGVPASSLFSVTGTPVTTSGTLGLVTTGTSGGIPYFFDTATLKTSALLANTGVVLGGGAGAAPNTVTNFDFASSTLNVPSAGCFGSHNTNGSTLCTGSASGWTSSDQFTAPSFVASGTGAGFSELDKGDGTAPTLVANAIQDYIPSTIQAAGYQVKRHATAGSGIIRHDNASNLETEAVAELSGDVTTSGSNATTIAANAVTTTKINNGAVTEAKQTLADNTTGNCSTSAHGYVPKGDGNAAHFLDGTCAFSTPAGGGGGNNNALFTSTADATVANTTTETSIIGTGVGSKTTSSNYFSAGTSLEMYWEGYFSSAVTDTLNVKLKAGSTVVGSTGAQAYGVLTNKVGKLVFIVTCRTTGASGTFQINTLFETAGSALAPQESQILNTSTVTLDTTGTLAWDITATWSAASASDTITGTNFIMYTPGTGVADPGANGILARTALNTTAARTITGTTNDVTVTNGDGVSGNPTLDIGSNVVTLTGTQSLTNKTVDSTNTNKIYPCAPQFSTSDTLTNSVTTEQVFATNCQIPANAIVANKVLRIWIGVNITATTTPQWLFKVKLCTVSGCATGTVINIYTSASVVAATAVTAQSGGVQVILQGTAAAGASVAVESSPIIGPDTGTQNVPFSRNNQATDVTGVPTNVALFLSSSITFSSTTGTNSITETQLVTEWLN